MPTFKITLPEIEVEEIIYLSTFENLAADITSNPSAYVLPQLQPIENYLKRGCELRVIKSITDGEDMLVINDERGRPLAGGALAYGRCYWVRSTNGKRTISFDRDVAEGWFETLPDALLRPDRGERLLGYDPDMD